MGSSNRILHILLMFYCYSVVCGDGFPRTAHASTSTAHQNGLLVLGNCRGRPVITPFFYHGRCSFLEGLRVSSKACLRSEEQVGLLWKC